MSPELETLDQLLGGELTLRIIANGYPDAYAFMRGVHSLLSGGDVRLLTNDGIEVRAGQWRDLFIEGMVMEKLDSLKLGLTKRGARRIE